MMSLRQPLLKDGNACGTTEPEKHSLFNLGGSTTRVKAGLSCVCLVSALCFVAAKCSETHLAQPSLESPLFLAAAEPAGVVVNTNLVELKKRENSKAKAVVLAMDEEVNRN